MKFYWARDTEQLCSVNRATGSSAGLYIIINKNVAALTLNGTDLLT